MRPQQVGTVAVYMSATGGWYLWVADRWVGETRVTLHDDCAAVVCQYCGSSFAAMAQCGWMGIPLYCIVGYLSATTGQMLVRGKQLGLCGDTTYRHSRYLSRQCSSLQACQEIFHLNFIELTNTLGKLHSVAVGCTWWQVHVVWL